MPDDTCKVLHAYWLTQYVERTHAFRLRTNRIIQFSAHQHERWADGFVIESSHDIQPRQTWHVEINQCNVNLVPLHHIQRFFTITRLGDAIASTNEALTNDLTKRHVIIGYKQIRGV